VTSVTETTAVGEQKVTAFGFPEQELVMSLVYRTNQTTDFKQRDYSFILVLICMALAVLLASQIFAPDPVGSGIASEITTAGL
jgi:hypothetical protein